MKYNSNIKLLLIISIIIFSNLTAQRIIRTDNLKSDFVKSENKQNYYPNLIKNAELTFNKPIDKNISLWIKSLRDVQSILLKNDAVFNGLQKALKYAEDNNKKFQRISLEVAYTLYSKQFREEISKIFVKSNDPVSYAIAVHYLLRSNFHNNNSNFYLENIEQRFPNFHKNEVLKSLHAELINISENKHLKTPNLTELLSHKFQSGKTILYSFHRKDRNYPGITIIKKPNGEFLKNDDGTIFNIPQLALSYSNLPSYIPSGNTPQGIFSIVGWYISPTETIGPTPNVLTRSPYEVSPKIFYHGQNKSQKWNLDEYKNLLPKSWQNYAPIYQSFEAGKSGRKLIIVHGSTDETEYFKESIYYPHTPTRGCLSSIEIWSGETGKCIKSDQSDLINAFKSVGQKSGYLIVLELDDQKKAVELKEIEPFIN